MADASEEHHVKSAGTFPVSSRSQTNVLWSAWKHKAPVNCPNKIHPSRSVYGRYCAPIMFLWPYFEGWWRFLWVRHKPLQTRWIKWQYHKAVCKIWTVDSAQEACAGTSYREVLRQRAAWHINWNIGAITILSYYAGSVQADLVCGVRCIHSLDTLLDAPC